MYRSIDSYYFVPTFQFLDTAALSVDLLIIELRRQEGRTERILKSSFELKWIPVNAFSFDHSTTTFTYLSGRSGINIFSPLEAKIE